MGKVLGIDLGTTNSVVAVWDGEAPNLVPNRQGGRLTPSVVAFGPKGEVHVGESAREHSGAHAENVIYSAKRFLGRSFQAAASDREEVHYEVVAGPHGEANFLVEGMTLAPERISGMVLRELKAVAEAHLGEPVVGAVLTAPAHFNHAQRAATREAGAEAGLEVHRILNEPTAAALAYGLDKMVDVERIVVVYDFGGGTFDVSILSVGEDIIEVIATAGDAHLGGDRIDHRISAWILSEFERTTGAPADESAETLHQLRTAAEAIKVALSERDQVEMDLFFPNENEGEPVPLRVSITRETLNGMIEDLVDRTLECCGRALEDAGRSPSLVDEIVMAGGSTRIPLVREKVAQYFDKEPLTAIDPDVVVAMGAAVQAGVIARELTGVVLVDVTSLSLGIQTNDGLTAVVIPRNSAIPTSATSTFATVLDGQTLVEFHVVQGEAKIAENNSSLGRFLLEGLTPAKAATSPIDVTFRVDINGMVLVTAKDRDSGAEQAVTISVNPGIAPERATTKPSESDVGPSGVGVPEGSDVPQVVLDTLDEVGELLAEAGPRMTRVDRAAMMKKLGHLRKLVAEGAASEEVERARAALAKVVVRVKTAKPARARD